MNPFNCPSTPPSRSHRTGSPRCSNYLEPPSTPNGDDNPFTTPNAKKTPNTRRNMGFLRTPNTSTKNKLNFRATKPSHDQKPNFPPTPEFTPHKNRKRKQFDTISNFQSPEQLSVEPSFGMFLPTPSTVGTGRKISPTKVLKAPPALDFSKITQFDDIFAHDEEEQNEEEEEDVYRLLTNDSLLKPKRSILSNLKMALKSEPQTPHHQLIDDDLVNKWHGKSLNDGVFSEEESVPSSPIANPFMNNSVIKSPTVHRKPSKVDYATHVEYVHNKTGQTKVVKLLDYQMGLKPKKLNFFNL